MTKHLTARTGILCLCVMVDFEAGVDASEPASHRLGRFPRKLHRLVGCIL